MGYYTRFTLDVQGEGPILDQFKAALDREDELCAYGPLQGVAEVKVNGKSYTDYAYTCKWYDYPDDMTQLSKDFPNLLFVLSGEGEESGDLWRTYYRNGHSQEVRAEIVFADPDLDKLPLDNSAEQKAHEAKLAELDQQKADLLARVAEIDSELDSLSAK